MTDILLSAGILIIPLLLCSVLALAIIIERTWQLKYNKVIPIQLTNSVLEDLKNKSLSTKKLTEINNSSPLGCLIVIVIRHIGAEPEIVFNRLQDQGQKIVHNLEKNLNLLGTIATISPLLGLLGTVIGMIDVFSVITEQGVGNPNVLAGGISQALITTAVGLTIAIPSLITYRSFQRKIDVLAYGLEHEAIYFYESVKAYLKEIRRQEAKKTQPTKNQSVLEPNEI